MLITIILTSTWGLLVIKEWIEIYLHFYMCSEEKNHLEITGDFNLTYFEI
jgi:hypothetical protein